MKPILSRPDAHISLFHFARVRTSRLRLPAPAFLDGVRAVFLADVHLRPGAPDRWLEALLAPIAAEKPDLVLLGGDYAESAAQAARFFAALGRLPRPRLGAWGVAGNNDRESFADVEALRACMAAGGATLLLNAHAFVPLRGGTLARAGVDEPKHGQPRPEAALAGTETADWCILLAHVPRWPETPVDLVLSGHTHGGQANVLGVTPYTFGFERARPPVVKGLARRGDMTMLVSRGVGYSRVPLRLGVYPELHVLEFCAAPGLSPV